MRRKYTCFASVLIATAAAQAANISWSTPTNISAVTDVVTGGTPFQINNFGPSGLSGTTINGVTFSPFATNSSGSTYTVGNITLAGNATVGGATVGTFGSGSSPYTALPAAYKAMLGSSAYTAGTKPNATTLTVTVGGLSIGATYEIQFWVNDSRGSVGPFRTEVLNGGGNQVTLAFNTNGSEGGLGQFVTGEFVASGATQSFVVTGSDTNVQTSNVAAQINGLQVLQRSSVSSTPAPPSLLLLLTGLAMAGLYWAWMGRMNSSRG